MWSSGRRADPVHTSTGSLPDSHTGGSTSNASRSPARTTSVHTTHNAYYYDGLFSFEEKNKQQQASL